MLNSMNLEYAKSWFASNHSRERLLKIYEYDNCYIFDSVPKGMEKEYGNIMRSAIGLDKETGEYFPYNPLKFSTKGDETVHIVENINDHYRSIGEEFVNRFK